MLRRGPKREPAGGLGEELEVQATTKRGVASRRGVTQRQAHGGYSALTTSGLAASGLSGFLAAFSLAFSLAFSPSL